MSKEKQKIGMYGETPKIEVGNYTISEFTLPPGDSIWIEAEDGEGGQFPKEKFLVVLKRFYDDSF